jgi:hypothetical protein
MQSQKNPILTDYNSKPKYLLKYQKIFKDLLEDNFYDNDFNKGKSTRDNFLINHNNMFPKQNSLFSTRYQILTGNKFQQVNFKDNNKYKNNKSYSQSNNYSVENTGLKSRNEKQENLINFRHYLKQNDIKYSNNKNNYISNGNNAFIEKLHSIFPEYSNNNKLNKGQTFLKGNMKNPEFYSLRNKLK